MIVVRAMDKWIWIGIIVIIIVLILVIKPPEKQNKWETLSSLHKQHEQKEKESGQKATLTRIYPSQPFRVYEMPFVLTAQQCVSLCQDAMPRLTPSKVYFPTSTMDGDADDVRTSMSCTLITPVTKEIMKMASTVTGAPMTNIEFVQVIRYKEGENFNYHYDTDPKNQTLPTWSRVATFMIYLNDGFIGGETEFPKIDTIITPITGKAVLFWSVIQGEIIPESLHRGRYIISGTKWIANTWIHSQSPSILIGDQLRSMDSLKTSDIQTLSLNHSD